MFMAGACGRNVHSSVLSWSLAQGSGCPPFCRENEWCSSLVEKGTRSTDLNLKLQTFNPGDFCTGHGELTSPFPRLSSILMAVVGPSSGGAFTAPLLPPAVRKYIFWSCGLWWCWCLYNAYIPHLLQPLHTVVFSLSFRPRAHEITFCTHKFCLLFSLFTILSSKLAGLPHKNFPTKSIPLMPHWCH